MARSRLWDVRDFGQSIWLDEVQRELFTGNGLHELIENDGLSGMTTNPAIFNKAIAGTNDYDTEIRKLAEEGLSSEEIFERLAISDIRAAADAFHPIFLEKEGRDGYVSAEVPASLAYDTDGTVAEALRLREAIDRENILIKVPGTPPGIAAIKQLTALGVNINVTLLFSVEQYERAAFAFISGLEDRALKGEGLGSIFSVASVFVSRIDTAVDDALKELSTPADETENGSRDGGLSGAAAIANAKVVYARFKEIFKSKEFSSLRESGANIQHIVWGSTGTKNPSYSNVKYVDNLIGPYTINTMPRATLEAFRDHGKIGNALAGGEAESRDVIASLAKHGIDLEKINDKLQTDGVVAFDESYDEMLDSIEGKRRSFARSSH